MLVSSTTEPTIDKRLRLSWTKRTVPLKSSTLFSKAKHSQEWHQNVEGTAGVLNPSDAKFPYAALRSHTDVYLKKKGKSNQSDTDIRLAILVDAHHAKQLAIAAAAHAMSAKSLRALLSVDTNVAHGSFWGLDAWLQCLIAANDGNPASVTDIEAAWARMLVPYMTQEQGTSAAGSYLKATGRALRKTALSNFNALPDFSILLQRAIAEYAMQLEGYRLKCQWSVAQRAVFWMSELDISYSNSVPVHILCLESIFDHKLPGWKSWVLWRPDFDRLARLTTTNTTALAILTDVLRLEGPDSVTGVARTLKEGLIARYEGRNPFIRYRGLIIEVPESTKGSLAVMLARLQNGAESIIKTLAVQQEGEALLQFWNDLFMSRPISDHSLKVLEAALDVPSISTAETYKVLRHVTFDDHRIGGECIASMQNLLAILDDPRTRRLQQLIIRERLLHGIETCISDCQDAIKQQMLSQATWMSSALGLYAFFQSVTHSVYVSASVSESLLQKLSSIPSESKVDALAEIYVAAQAYSQASYRAQKTKSSIVGSSLGNDILDDIKVEQHPLEEIIEHFCRYRLLDFQPASSKATQMVDKFCQLWQNTKEPSVDVDRRALAIMISKITASDDGLQARCLTELSCKSTLMEPPTFTKSLLDIVVLAMTNLPSAILDFVGLLTKAQAWTQCWKDLLYMWMLKADGDDQIDMLDFSLQRMKAAEWLSFIQSLNSLFDDKVFSTTEERIVPTFLHPELQSWVGRLSKYSHTLSRLETALGGCEVARSILKPQPGRWSKIAFGITMSIACAENNPVEVLMHKIVGMLVTTEESALKIKRCVTNLGRELTSEAVEFCHQIWDMKDGHMTLFGMPKVDKGKQPATVASSSTSSHTAASQSPARSEILSVEQAVAEVMIAGWLQDTSVSSVDRFAIEVRLQTLTCEDSRLTQYQCDSVSPMS